jgi:hypothetical protein
LAISQEVKQLLQEGIVAAKAGEAEEARQRLLDVIEQDQTNETAWYWLYQVFEREDDKRVCLENLIIINPHNRWAKQQLLDHLEASTAVAPQPAPAKRRARRAAPAKPVPVQARPLTLKLITAFWLGISVIFLTSGIISAGEWLLSALRSRDMSTISIVQFLELLVTISFLTSALLGFFVAVALFLRSMIGFYGSLLLALGLLLFGPTVSLVAQPPSYLTLVCTIGTAGMIFFLTLASQSGFRGTAQDEQPSH